WRRRSLLLAESVGDEEPFAVDAVLGYRAGWQDAAEFEAAAAEVEEEADFVASDGEVADNLREVVIVRSRERLDLDDGALLDQEVGDVVAEQCLAPTVVIDGD